MSDEAWVETADGLTREFVFADFSEAFAFMTRVALVAEKHDHHPDWSNSWNRVTITLVSHDAGNQITERDRRMATAIESIVGD
jgi:4a-hydroxytetrahydrobiopterin dehydratase